MTPAQFLNQLANRGPSPVNLFLGSEAYQREKCRRALLEKVLPEAERESGLTRLDLAENTLAEVIDDARSLSLFSPKRLIWISSAELALPRGRASAAERDEGSAAALASAYAKDPSPGVVVVFEASRYDCEGEGKKKLERVRKYYSFIRDYVEFPRYTHDNACRLAQELARDAGVRLGSTEISLLVEAVGGEAARIAIEIEKLRLYSGDGVSVSAEQIALLVPNAPATTIFASGIRAWARRPARSPPASGPTCAGRRIPAPGPGFSWRPVPSSVGGQGSRTAQPPTDPVPFFQDWYGHVAFKGQTSSTDSCFVFHSTIEIRARENIRSRQSPARRPAGRQDNHGEFRPLHNPKTGTVTNYPFLLRSFR